MSTFAHPPDGGQRPDPPEPRRGRYSTLRLTEDEARAVRVAIRKVASARGGYVALAVRLGIPASTLYAAARPTGRPSPGLAIRLAAVAGVPVEVLLGGKLAVSPPVIGRAA